MNNIGRILANSTAAALVGASLRNIDTELMRETLDVPESQVLDREQKDSYNRMKMILFFASEYQKAFPSE